MKKHEGNKTLRHIKEEAKIMTKEQAIQALVQQGYTEQEAISEFNASVRWFLKGAGYTAEAIRYATECAIADILDDGVDEITDEYLTMLELRTA